MRNVAQQIARTPRKRLEAGLFAKYLSGSNILSIGYRRADANNAPVVAGAIRIDLDRPGYDGIHLPFPDESQDAIFSSDSYEHIGDYRKALCEWYRVLKIGGFIVVFVPHKFLYERKAIPPSLFDPDHKRFYTPGALMAEFEEALPPNGFRVRHLADNDVDFDYSTPPGQHAKGCHEIELVIQKIARPQYSDALELTSEQKKAIEQQSERVVEIIGSVLRNPSELGSLAGAIASMHYFPAYETLRSKIVDRRALKLPVTEGLLKAVLARLLPYVDMDEQLYLATYPGIGEAVSSGFIHSARAHFEAHGYFEGRIFQNEPAVIWTESKPLPSVTVSLDSAATAPPVSATAEEVAVPEGCEVAIASVASRDVLEVASPSLRDLALRFESLGQNCEFGLVQRRCGAEPVGLFRFASAPLPNLLAALDARFAGLGEPANVEVQLSDNRREYIVFDRAFGFLHHAWVLAGELSPEQIHERECRRIPFLIRKLTEDLGEAGKLFVYHGMEELSEADVQRLLSALHRYGPGTLLWVELADGLHPPGTVVRLGPQLLKGYIDRLAPSENAHDFSFECWLAVCRAAYGLWRSG